MKKDFDIIKFTEKYGEVKLGRYKLWVNEQNDKFFPDRIVRQSVKKHSSQPDKPIQIALEIDFVRHISSYALLGFEFKPDLENKQDIDIIVQMKNKQEMSRDELLAIRGKNIHTGIPEEYGACILEAAVEAVLETGNWSPGEIVFSTGAYCDVGSSILIFKKITRAVIGLSRLDLFNMLDSEIKSEIQRFGF